jgi:hypothetical protein
VEHAADKAQEGVVEIFQSKSLDLMKRLVFALSQAASVEKNRPLRYECAGGRAGPQRLIFGIANGPSLQLAGVTTKNKGK